MMRKLLIVICAILLIGCRSKKSHPLGVSPPSVATTSPGLVGPEILIEVDEARLAAFGLTLQDVQSALLAQHLAVRPSAPGSFVVTTTSAPSDVLAVAIKFRDGVAIRLSDVARASTR